MNGHRASRKRSVTAISWIARLWSITSLGFVLFLLAGEFIDPHSAAPATLRAWLGLFLFPFGVCLGMIVAWRWEGLGGGITLGSLVAFYAVCRILDGNFPRGPWFAIIAAPGILFLLGWLRALTKRQDYS